MELEQVTSVKAQLLGFMLYGSAGSIERLLKAFGSESVADSAAALTELLPGPHPVLRCIASMSSGSTAFLKQHMG